MSICRKWQGEKGSHSHRRPTTKSSFKPMKKEEFSTYGTGSSIWLSNACHSYAVLVLTPSFISFPRVCVRFLPSLSLASSVLPAIVYVAFFFSFFFSTPFKKLSFRIPKASQKRKEKRGSSLSLLSVLLSSSLLWLLLQSLNSWP